ncbi:WSC domain-containing protein [Rhizophagus irregularis DAOM 181602=DAOM 197198]|nr:WSC domain-containing protein [Rhizophagus irregularis DAOM 181602=DAOM 197198]
MANEACDSCDENGNILYQDPQVTPLGCYVFDNSSVIDTFNGLATLNSPKRPGLVFNDPYTYQIRMNLGHCLKRCIDFKFNYGALEGGVNCRYGYANALQSYIKDDDKKCNMYCTTATFTGNVTYPCGGKDAYTVYKVAVHLNYTPPYNITLEEKLDIMHNVNKDKIKYSRYKGSIPPNTSPTPSPIPPSLLNFTLTLKIVLGVCIPVFLIAILIIVIIVYNRRCKTKETEKTDEKYRKELHE